MPNIWVSSPHQLLRQGLMLMVASMGHQAQAEAIPAPDLALSDLSSHRPHTSTLPPPPPFPTLAILSGNEAEYVLVLRLGYKGYLHPETSPEVLSRAIQAVLKGELWAERQVLSRVIREHGQVQLTPRERQIMLLVNQGHSNREVAKKLGIAEKTVKVHVGNLFDKLGIKSRLELLELELHTG